MTLTGVHPVLVTGATGRVGRLVVDLLLDAGVPVSWIASNLAHTSMGAGRKLAYKMP